LSAMTNIPQSAFIWPIHNSYVYQYTQSKLYLNLYLINAFTHIRWCKSIDNIHQNLIMLENYVYKLSFDFGDYTLPITSFHCWINIITVGECHVMSVSTQQDRVLCTISNQN
jgi:hypothetical protein